LTRRIHETGDFLKISLLDHVIVSDQKYFSIRHEEETWPPRSPPVARVAAAELEKLRGEEEALQVIRGAPAFAALKMEDDNLGGGIKEQVDKLDRDDPAYMRGPRAEIIAAFALELYRRSRKKGGEQK
jgi:RadC-like JAB domain